MYLKKCSRNKIDDTFFFFFSLAMINNCKSSLLETNRLFFSFSSLFFNSNSRKSKRIIFENPNHGCNIEISVPEAF